MSGARGVLARIRGLAGRLRRGLRSLLDGALHGRRHRRARLLVRSLQDPGHVLFLCLGNVCRSPYAEARFRTMVGRAAGAPGAASAGFIGPGRPPPGRALDEASGRGVDTSGHSSRIVTPAMMEQADLVVVMETSQRRRLKRLMGPGRRPVVVLGDLDPRRVDRRSIQDPWGSAPDVFENVFDRIDRCVEVLVEELQRGPRGEAVDPSGSRRTGLAVPPRAGPDR